MDIRARRQAVGLPLADRVERHRDDIRSLVVTHHAADPRLFGSVARGQASTGSDIDLLVDFTDDASLLDEIGLRIALRDLLQADVDVVGVDTLRGEMRERVQREAVPVERSASPTSRGERSSPCATSPRTNTTTSSRDGCGAH